ncbi:N-6 DNA methylase [Leifsonia sp. Leaf264]|uniref:N-6 DNA methylase n=1 Tax=Leifsonia sp. Leaf264 TaxID=1736314 RepID=UPI0006FAE56A|nr:N-6 DNA methylase [Leifsonia sp. Leaf264]KQP01444.1 restriction endonuclease subunit M [Leifsonia sp. Leaf264]
MIERPAEPLVKSKKRVADHGEVFTPDWMVEGMLDLVRDESARIDSRVLEPACGSGNFLVPVLSRKLATVEARYGTSEFDRRHHALLALMCIYGIELLEDNAVECRGNLLGAFAKGVGTKPGDDLYRAAEHVLGTNIIRGDALSMTTFEGNPIVFPEWGYIGKGRYQRRDFRYDSLTQRASFQGTLWDHLEEHEIFTPTREYPLMTIEELAG